MPFLQQPLLCTETPRPGGKPASVTTLFTFRANPHAQPGGFIPSPAAGLRGEQWVRCPQAGSGWAESCTWKWDTHQALKLLNPPRCCLTQVHTPSPDPALEQDSLGGHRCRPRGRSQSGDSLCNRPLPGLCPRFIQADKSLANPMHFDSGAPSTRLGSVSRLQKGSGVHKQIFAGQQHAGPSLLPIAPGTGTLVAAVPQNCHPPVLPWLGFIPSCEKPS